MSQTNPLQNFFRKPKFSVQLPSRGKWYPKNALSGTDGTVEIYGVTASDDTRFKSNETFLSLTAMTDLLRSCVPAITNPELMPLVDLDLLLLNIRRASYSPTVPITADVPGTDQQITVDLDIEQLTAQFPNAQEQWDENLTIMDDAGNQLDFVICPVTVKSMFGATKFVLRQQQAAAEISMSNRKNDEKIDDMDEQFKNLSSLAVNIVSDSIQEIRTGTTTVKNPAEIRNFLNQIDLEYFRAIQNHINKQKERVTFADWPMTSSAEQIAAGAPEQWLMPVNFDLNRFFE